MNMSANGQLQLTVLGTLRQTIAVPNRGLVFRALVAAPTYRCTIPAPGALRVGGRTGRTGEKRANDRKGDYETLFCMSTSYSLIVIPKSRPSLPRVKPTR